MRYLIKEMREVVVINNLPCVRKWQETFEVLEEITPMQNDLKGGFEPDTLVRKNNGEILLLRDEDRSPRKIILSKEDIIKDINTYQVLKKGNRIPMNVEYLDYYNMILNKMLSYERDGRIDSLLNKEEEIKWS